MKKDEYNYWLSNIERIGIKKIGILLNQFENAKHIYEASGTQLKARTNLSASDIEKIIKSKDKKRIKEEYELLLDKGIKFIAIDDTRYPAKLKEIYDPPFSLYVKGNLPDRNKKMLAIIGARECSNYGIEVSKYIAKTLAQEGIPIISGLARGIDSYAHYGALLGKGMTYGVLGCGIDICYPRENINLYMDMQENGGVISEYGLGKAPIPGHFPMRNRIISGLSDAILVIEARKKSGTLITVDMGLDQGKDIYAVPGRISDSLSEGCNNLIKMGAKLIGSPEDIIEELLISYEKNSANNNKNINSLETKDDIVYASLGFMPKHIEEIAGEVGISVTELAEILLGLEIKDLIRQTTKNFYVANK